MVRVAAFANLGSRPREQFILVDRPQEIVVDADLEPAEQPGAAVGLRNRENRNMPRSLERASLATQSQAVEIVEAERNDQKVVIAVSGVEERFQIGRAS